MTLKIAFFFLILALIISCREEKLEKVNYFELAKEKKIVTKNSSVTPIDEKLIAEKNYVFADSLLFELEAKIIKLYRSNAISKNCFPNSLKAYVEEKNEWNKYLKNHCDSISTQCGNYYYCDVEVMEYRYNTTCSRIKALDSCLKMN